MKAKTKETIVGSIAGVAVAYLLATSFFYRFRYPCLSETELFLAIPQMLTLDFDRPRCPSNG